MQSYRWHPALEVSARGPLVEDVPLHVQQSDVDGACGACCALMALMLFRIVRRDELATLAHARKKRLREFWRDVAGHYFDGLYPGQLQSILRTYAQDVSSALECQDCVPRLLAALGEAGLGIVNIQDKTMSHWTLAVGMGGQEAQGRFHPNCLLILDPSRAPTPLAPCNGLLSVRSDRRGRHAYDTPAERKRVDLACVLVLRRKKHAR